MRQPPTDITSANNIMTTDLVIENLSKEFTSLAGALSILQNVSWSLSRGESVAVTGPSGSGKSTLLSIIGLLDVPTSGQLTILGEEPLKLTSALQAAFRNQHIGFVFQDHHLLPQCTVLENVLIATLPGSGAGKEEEQRAKELLERVGLTERLTHKPAELSGGEKQRVAVCRALINRPALLLADEPTGNLDHHTAESVGTMLLELGKEENALTICVTHSREFATQFSRQFELQNGQLEERTV